MLADVEVTRAYGYNAVSAGAAEVLRPGRARTGGSAFACPTGISSPPAFELPGQPADFYEDEQRIGHWVAPARRGHYGDHEALREWLRHAHALTAGRV